jgi:RNA polymerase-binding transcription factor DksA
MINEKDLLKLKIELEARKKDLEEKIKKLSSPVDFGDDIEGSEDMSEEADEAEEYGNNLSVADALKKELADVNSGLDKIAKGVYGECDSCDHCGHCH